MYMYKSYTLHIAESNINIVNDIYTPTETKKRICSFIIF